MLLKGQLNVTHEKYAYMTMLPILLYYIYGKCQGAAQEGCSKFLWGDWATWATYFADTSALFSPVPGDFVLNQDFHKICKIKQD